MSKFSEKFKELRKSRGLSQQELATYLHTSKSSVNMYERGEREPGLEMLENIADYFNVDMDYLMGKTNIANKTLMMNVKPGYQTTLGERIKELRQRAGLTQEELAKEIGYSTKTSISKIENDVLDINQSTIVALARALKTTPSVIMGWSEINDVPFSLNKASQASSPEFTDQEIIVALAYRNHPAEQTAVDRILEINWDEYENISVAAKGGHFTAVADKAKTDSAVSEAFDELNDQIKKKY